MARGGDVAKMNLRVRHTGGVSVAASPGHSGRTPAAKLAHVVVL